MDFSLSTALSLADFAVRLTLTQDLQTEVRVAKRTDSGNVIILWSSDGYSKPHHVWPGDEVALWRPVSLLNLEALQGVSA